jgi:hypothetical protein
MEVHSLQDTAAVRTQPEFLTRMNVCMGGFRTIDPQPGAQNSLQHGLSHVEFLLQQSEVEISDDTAERRHFVIESEDSLVALGLLMQAVQAVMSKQHRTHLLSA